MNIYRCKGVIHAADAPERRAVLQVVGKRVEITLADGWSERKPRPQIVAIGAPGGLDAEALPNLSGHIDRWLVGLHIAHSRREKGV